MRGAEVVTVVASTYLGANFRRRNRVHSIITTISGDSTLLQESGQDLKVKARDHRPEVAIE